MASAVASDVHPVAFVFDSSGYAADFLALLQDDGVNSGPAKQLKRGGKACRSCADDDRNLALSIAGHYFSQACG